MQTIVVIKKTVTHKH